MTATETLSSAGIRLIATDLDGTLLRSDDTVSDRTRAALRDATAAGLVVAFVTGRPPRWLDDVIDETGHVGVAVGANGAVLYDMADQTLLSVHALSPELMVQIGTELRTQFPDVAFAVEYPSGFAAEPGYVHDWQVNPRRDRHGRPMPTPPMGALNDIAGEAGIKLLAKDRSAQPDRFLAAATELLGDRATITHSSSYGLLEIAAAGVTKATGLAELAARHDIRREDILAVGDMPNDIPMLQWAGHSFAMANGHASARAAAAVTVGTNDDDAVAELIERVLA